MSQPGHRPSRKEESLEEYGQNSYEKLQDALDQGDIELAKALAEYLFEEGKHTHDTYTDWAYADLNYVALHYGEEEIPKILRYAREVLSVEYAKTPTTTMLERVKLYAERMRAHRSGPRELGDFRIWEEPDRYIMEMNPCGSGGRMARGPLDGTGSRMNAPFNLGKTGKPYTWSWSKANIPYYCVHCCVWNEVMGIEKNGYPMRVTEFTSPSEPCHWYFYKDADLIPAEYFERVGFKKDPSKFKRA